MFGMFAAALLTTQAVPASPKVDDVYEEFGRSGSFEIMTDRSETCSTYFEYGSDGALLSLVYLPRDESVTLTFVLPAMKAIKVDKTYEVELSFIIHDKLDDGWGKVTATGAKWGERPALRIKLRSAPALKDIEVGTVVGLYYNEVNVAAFNLKNLAAPVRVLKQCGERILKNHPIDPFE